jgi:putative transposase
MYFNKKYERTGVLFEGKFKAQHADTDEHLKYLFSYIHLNPIKLIQSNWKDVGIHNLEEAKQYLSQFMYSSLHDYTKSKSREQSLILAVEKFPKYLESRNEIDSELISWLNYRNEIERNPHTEARPM